MKLFKLTTWILALGITVGLSGCKKDSDSDPCDGVSCLNGGTCNDGSCACPAGYFGSNCASLDLNVSITIKSIVISNYPQTFNGNAWDDPILGTSTPPDIQWIFTRPNGNSIYGSYALNANGTAITYPESSDGLPFTILSPDVDEVNTLSIYDVDDIDSSDLGSANDFMGGYDWVPDTFIDDAGNSFPSTIVIGADGGLQFTLEVTYQW